MMMINYNTRDEFEKLIEFLKTASKQHAEERTFLNVAKKNLKELYDWIRHNDCVNTQKNIDHDCKVKTKQGVIAFMSLFSMCLSRNAIKGDWDESVEMRFRNIRYFFSIWFLKDDINKMCLLNFYLFNKEFLNISKEIRNPLIDIKENDIKESLTSAQGKTFGSGWEETWRDIAEWKLIDFVGKEYFELYENIIENGYTENNYQNFIELYLNKPFVKVDKDTKEETETINKWYEEYLSKCEKYER